MLEMKGQKERVQNLFDRFIRRLNITKEIITEPEDESTETFRIETQRGKGIFKSNNKTTNSMPSKTILGHILRDFSII